MQEFFKVYEQCDINHLIEVSNLGRMKVDGCLHTFSGNQRYCMYYKFYLHRMVAELFIPNPENKPFVDHIDSDRYNNAASNLRWVTYKENANNPSTIKKIKEGLDKPGVREKISNSVKMYYVEHPEAKEAVSKSRKEYYKDPENRKKSSKAMRNKRGMTDGYIKVHVEPEYWGEFIDIGFWFINKRFRHTYY